MGHSGRGCITAELFRLDMATKVCFVRPEFTDWDIKVILPDEHAEHYSTTWKCFLEMHNRTKTAELTGSINTQH